MKRQKLHVIIARQSLDMVLTHLSVLLPPSI